MESPSHRVRSLGTITSFRVRDLQFSSTFEGNPIPVLCKNGQPVSLGETVTMGDELSVRFPEGTKLISKHKWWERIPFFGERWYRKRTLITVSFELTEW